MNLATLLIAGFAVLIGALMLPLPHGARSAVFLALIVLGVLTFVGGSMHYLISFFG